MEIDETILGRIKTIQLQLADVTSDINKNSKKIQIHNVFDLNNLEITDDTCKCLGLLRDTSDLHIQTGSLIRRLCDLMEPLIEEKK